MVSGSGDRLGGAVGDNAAQAESKQSAENGCKNRVGAGGFIGFAAEFDQFAVFAISHIQRVGGILYPGGSVLLEIVNLQFGDRGVSGVDVFTLIDQWLGKLFAPGLLQLFDLGERGALLLGVGQSFSLRQFVAQGAHAFVHALHFAGIAAQQVVAQVKAVLHHLEAHFIGGVSQFKRSGCGSLGSVLALHRHDIHQKQHDHHAEDDAKIHVQLFPNRHAVSSGRA